MRLRWPKYIGKNHSKFSKWSKMLNFFNIAKIMKTAKFIIFLITMFKLVWNVLILFNVEYSWKYKVNYKKCLLKLFSWSETIFDKVTEDSDSHNGLSVNISSSFCVVNEAWFHISLLAHSHNYYTSRSITVALLAV